MIMRNKALLILLLAALSACSEGKKYRDTADLETPPRLAINEKSSLGQQEAEQKDAKNSLAESVFIDDAESPSVLKIKKLFDRAWDIVGQALEKKAIEITDKNRDKGVYFVKYDPSADTGEQLFGNVKIFIFEEEYREAPYKLTIVWRDTETEVRTEMLPQTESDENNDDEEFADGSSKLLKVLYEAIRDEPVE